MKEKICKPKKKSQVKGQVTQMQFSPCFLISTLAKLEYQLKIMVKSW